MSLQLDFNSSGDLPALQGFVDWHELLEPLPTRAQVNTPPCTPEGPLVQLLKKIAAGDSAAFAELHRHCRPMMFSTALRVLQKPELAEEAVQEALVKIWQRSAQFNISRGNARTWITAVTRNQALDTVRQKRPPEISIDEHIVDSFEVVDTAPEPDEVIDMQTSLALFNDVLAIMPSAMRQSVLMSCYEGYTHTEIAEHMQAPVGTVKAWIRRGLQKLRASVEPESPMQLANA